MSIVFLSPEQPVTQSLKLALRYEFTETLVNSPSFAIELHGQSQHYIATSRAQDVWTRIRAIVPNPTILVIMSGSARGKAMINCPANAFEISQAAQIRDVISSLTDEDINRLEEHLFPPIAPVIEAPDALFRLLLDSTFRVFAGGVPEDEVPTKRKRKLPKDWEKQLEVEAKEPVPISAEENTCCICMDKERNVIYIPCGHLVSCGPCAKATLESKSTCPICRGKVEDVQIVKR